MRLFKVLEQQESFSKSLRAGPMNEALNTSISGYGN